MNPRCTQCASELDPGVTVCWYCGAENVMPPAEFVAIPIEPFFPAPAQVSDGPAEIVVPFGAALLDDDRYLDGIGGGLLLVAIGLVVAPFAVLATIAGAFWPLFTSSGALEALQTQPTLYALVLSDLAANVVLLLVVLGVNYLFFKRKKSFPAITILFLILQLIFATFDLIVIYALAPSPEPSALSVSVLVRCLIGAFVYVPYLLVSRRAKVTFVN